MTFRNGSTFEKNFSTPQGSITILADVHIFGLHLVLDELLFYPTESTEPLPIGVRSALEIVRALQNLARIDGFAEITVGFHRTGKDRHGRTISVTRRLK